MLNKPAIQEQSKLAVFVFGLGLILYVCISSSALTALKIPYDAPTGNFVFKIHIGTYLIMAAFAVALCHDGNPLRRLLTVLRQCPGLSGYLGANIFLLSYSVARYGASGSAFIIETLIMPGICAFMMHLQRDSTQRKLFYLLIGLVTFNVLLGIGESILQKRIVPFTVAGGIVIKEDLFRSTALLGHPLSNALVTGPMLVTALTLRWRPIYKITLIGTLLLGLLSFGGRTSFLSTTMLVMGYLGYLGIRKVIAGRYGYIQIMGGLVTIFFVIAAAISVVVVTGIGERIFAHLNWDSSANVRLRIWEVFKFMGSDDLFFGMAPLNIATVIYRLSLLTPIETIENFWLVMLMQFGIMGFVPFLIGLWTGFRYLWKRNERPARLAILLFIAVASSNNSLSTKTSALSLLFTAWCGAAAYSRLASKASLTPPAFSASFASPKRRQNSISIRPQ